MSSAILQPCKSQLFAGHTGIYNIDVPVPIAIPFRSTGLLLYHRLSSIMMKAKMYTLQNTEPRMIVDLWY
jgi:hypothetical protein